MGSPGIADIVPQPEGFEPQRGRLQIPEGLFTRPAQVADGFIVDGGHIHGSEVPGAHQPGQWPGVTTVGFDPVAGCLGNHGRSDDSADMACLRQIARQPVPTRSRFIDKDQGLGV